MQSIIDDIAGKGAVRVDVADRMFGRLPDDSTTEVFGASLDQLVLVSLNAPKPFNTINHEIIHELRRTGLFDDAKGASRWRLLEGRARKKWLDLKDESGRTVRERYGSYPEDILLEEAVAEAFAAWRDGALKADTAVRPLFDRIKRFLEQVANWLFPAHAGLNRE